MNKLAPFFPGFDLGFWSPLNPPPPSRLTGVLIGKPTLVHSKQNAYVNDGRALRSLGCEHDGGSNLTRWSDHSGIHVRIKPPR